MIKNIKMSWTVGALIALPVCLGPISLNADQTFIRDSLPSMVRNIAEGYEAGEGDAAIKEEFIGQSLSFVNRALDQVEERAVTRAGFTHLELTLGTDAFGLDAEGTSAQSDVMAVMRLYETQNMFLFNQTSLARFDGRTTLNLGMGARHINDNDTIIIGANVFYDYELDSAHRRTGYGLELMTSMLDLRANSYNAISGAKVVKGVNEEALSGHDIKLSAHLPYFYTSNLYYKQSVFGDGDGYSIRSNEWGIEAEVLPNFTLRIAQQDSLDRRAETVTSASYSIALGGPQQNERSLQDGVWKTSMQPIREKLYKPVERENRIIKKAVKFDVTVSGY